jgi:hypothetical protein
MMTLHGAPVAGTVREVFESAICMARQAMTALEISDDEIERAEHDYRDVDGRRLLAQSEAGDLHAGGDLMIIPGAPRPDTPVSIPAESG